jgi:beta-aspartyl-peptidase (threonine type)
MNRHSVSMLLVFVLCPMAVFASPPDPVPKVVLVMHGGAGALPRSETTAEHEAGLRADMRRALETGYAIIREGGRAVDAASAAVVVLEDSPLYNAGRGAVLNAEGVAELDAAIMEGHTRRAGAVAGLTRVRNPILLSRKVMEESPHVMMIGAGAEAFASGVGIDLVDPGYFITPRRKQELEAAKARELAVPQAASQRSRFHIGTVGAVALDQDGYLVAATSTGGRTNKRWGRVGDVPVIGAGTWADSNCAVSATGWGEFFIRVGVAHAICARVAFKGETVAQAAEAVLADVASLGGDGGVIVLDAKGNATLPYNTGGMVRGTVDENGLIEIRIWEDQ